MGCFRIFTKQDVQQLRDGWKPVPSDRRYEEKIVQRPNGRTTRMTRIAGQTTEYPHNTEFYKPGGGKEHFDNDPRWDSHFSTGHGKSGEHFGTHKTAQAILDDLDAALKSLK